MKKLYNLYGRLMVILISTILGLGITLVLYKGAQARSWIDSRIERDWA